MSGWNCLKEKADVMDCSTTSPSSPKRIYVQLLCAKVSAANGCAIHLHVHQETTATLYNMRRNDTQCGLVNDTHVSGGTIAPFAGVEVRCLPLGCGFLSCRFAAVGLIPPYWLGW